MSIPDNETRSGGQPARLHISQVDLRKYYRRINTKEIVFIHTVLSSSGPFSAF